MTISKTHLRFLKKSDIDNFWFEIWLWFLPSFRNSSYKLINVIMGGLNTKVKYINFDKIFIVITQKREFIKKFMFSVN